MKRMTKAPAGGSKAGFTLVELIVVIAILGILAGIAVPVYSGYIDKAGEAADMQLLGAVNTAFAAACAGHDLNPANIVNYGASLVAGAAGKNVAGVTITDPAYSALSDAVNADFVLYYGDNNGAEFRNFAVSDIFFEGGIFTGTGNVFAGRWAASNFADNETVLLEALDTVSGLIGTSASADTGRLSAFMTLALSAHAKYQAAMDALPDDYKGLSPEQMLAEAAKIGAQMEDMEDMMDDDDFDWDAYDGLDNIKKKLTAAASAGKNDALWNSLGITDYANAMKNITGATAIGNASVLYVAKDASTMDAVTSYELMGSFKNSITDPTLSDKVKDVDEESLAQIFGSSENSVITNLALAYSLSTGYYNSDYFTGTAPSVGSGDGMKAMLTYMQTAMSDSGFVDYYTSDGMSDTSAFISAMSAINDNAGAIDTTSDSAFSSEETLALLNSLLGN